MTTPEQGPPNPTGMQIMILAFVATVIATLGCTWFVVHVNGTYGDGWGYPLGSDQVYAPGDNCRDLVSLRVAIPSQAGYTEEDKYFCTDYMETKVQILQPDGTSLTITPETWSHRWSGNNAFIIIKYDKFAPNESEWKAFVRKYPTEPRLKFLSSLCRTGIPVRTVEGSACADLPR